MQYQRDISVTDAISGKLIRVLRVTSPTPITKTDAIHAVIQHEDRKEVNR